MEKTRPIEKPLEEYDYKEIESLKCEIKRLPEFIMINDIQNKWFDKLTDFQNKILDKIEKDHSIYSRKEKVEKYINYSNLVNSWKDSIYIKDGKVWNKMDDRFPCEGTIDEYYMNNRYSIEEYIEKILRVAPLTKEQLEEIIIQNEKIYLDENK